MAATLSAYIQRDEDLIAVVRSTVAIDLTTSNATLERLFTTIGPGRYPGVVGLAYVEKVPEKSLSAFQRQVSADPPLGQPLTQSFALIPPGSRPDYCLTRLIAAHRSSIAKAVDQPKSIGAALVPLLNPGFDYCQSSFNTLLQAAASSGSPEVGQIVPLLSQSLHSSKVANAAVDKLIEVAMPVYRPGAVLTKVAERQAAIVGWTAGLIDPQQATAPILQGVIGLSMTLHYRNPTGVTSTIVSAGHRQGGDIRRTVPLSVSGPWSAVI
ncbi:MAG: hypothetical protein ACRDYB_02805, partial [Acidimicrobiales bacterium]